MDERLSWPGWLTHSGHFTHEVVTCQPYIRRRSGKVRQPKTDVLTSEPQESDLLSALLRHMITKSNLSCTFVKCLLHYIVSTNLDPVARIRHLNLSDTWIISGLSHYVILYAFNELNDGKFALFPIAFVTFKIIHNCIFDHAVLTVNGQSVYATVRCPLSATERFPSPRDERQWIINF